MKWNFYPNCLKIPNLRKINRKLIWIIASEGYFLHDGADYGITLEIFTSILKRDHKSIDYITKKIEFLKSENIIDVGTFEIEGDFGSVYEAKCLYFTGVFYENFLMSDIFFFVFYNRLDYKDIFINLNFKPFSKI